ncbi:uncharacterized protein PG986_005945 [Apiospora aurea]|uniref:Uncharacterized protein n=1 Tax=Apiospora aurea TaxID=335848 RepID=A0ABR1QIZ9_9PEZI
MSFFAPSLPSRAFARDKVNDENRPSKSSAAAAPQIPLHVLTKRDDYVRHDRVPQDTTPVASLDFEEGAEYQRESESCVTAPRKAGSDLSRACSPSSTYAPEGRLSSLSDHGRSSANSLVYGQLTSMSSIELFCGTRFDASWARSHSSIGIEQGPNLMEELEAATGPRGDSDTSLAATALKVESATSSGVEVPPWVVQASEPSISPSESELEGISSTDTTPKGRHFLGTHKWARVFWKSRARFLQALGLEKPRKL